MRERIQRAKTVGTNIWVEGTYFPPENTIISHKQNTFSGGYPDYVVVPETVGDYIGVMDKHSTRIFDGDIVRHPCLTSPQVVHWNDEWCAFGPIFDARPIEAFPLLSETNEIEVIGNIYDNPELLEDNQ